MAICESLIVNFMTSYTIISIFLVCACKHKISFLNIYNLLGRLEWKSYVDYTQKVRKYGRFTRRYTGNLTTTKNDEKFPACVMI